MSVWSPSSCTISHADNGVFEGAGIVKVFAALALLATPLAAADVPSGQPVTLHEVLVDAQETTTYLRFRFLAPQIGKSVDFDLAGPDMMHLCQNVALEYMTDYALEGDKIVISFMDRITEFGVPDPDAVQYFEAFKPKNDTCMWDDF